MAVGHHRRRGNEAGDEGGLLVPHRMTAVWDVGGQAIPYARFLVERLEYDTAAPF
jgi:hypothetical protein